MLIFIVLITKNKKLKDNYNQKININKIKLIESPKNIKFKKIITMKI